MLRRFSLLLFAAGMVAHGTCWAGEPPAPAAANPLEQATAELRINDPRWLDRILTRFAGAYGIDDRPLRRHVARRLLHCRDLDGIDLSRPILVAWRPNRVPLLAIIPVGKRAAFVDGFGATVDGEPPMVRVGDRDGSVVYTQTDAGGLREYRLLVSDNTAYLAPTVAECRALAAAGMPPTGANPAPLIYRSRGRAPLLSQIATDLTGAASALPGQQLAATLTGLDPWTELSNQFAQLQLEVRPSGDDSVALTGHVTPRLDTALAAWLGVQRNAANRLLPSLPREGAAITAWWNIDWQGALSTLHERTLPTLRQQAKSPWSDAVEDGFRQAFSLNDRSPSGALVVTGKARGAVAVAVIEQSRAIELAQFISRNTAALTGGPSEPVAIGSIEGHRVRNTVTGPDGKATVVDQVVVGTDRHCVQVQDAAGGDAAELAVAAVDKLVQAAPLPGNPGLAGLRIDCTAIVKAQLPAERVSETELPQAVIDAFLAVTASGDRLVLKADIPVIAIGQVGNVLTIERRGAKPVEPERGKR
ncbi:hypothetical protein LBMAG53_28850 [Planctomycetota bacterium]|nr:hypothetical protein LBMAG53_28850 [Planctomycetota bacterium]